MAGNVAEVFVAVVFAKKKTTEAVTLGIEGLYGAACSKKTFFFFNFINFDKFIINDFSPFNK